jgi:hypothetical protein
MPFQKVILFVFLFTCIFLFPDSLESQTSQNVTVETDEQIDQKQNTMVLQKRKRVLSKSDKENQIQQIKKRKAIQKKNKLYLSTSRIELAKTELEKMKKRNKISQKEILREEKKIKRSEAQLKEKRKEVSQFYEKVAQ